MAYELVRLRRRGRIPTLISMTSSAWSWGLAFIALTLHHPPAQAFERIERAEPAMGTVARIVVEAGDERAATTALNAAFARIREIEQRLSDYTDTSEVRQLERAPVHTAVPVSPDLYRVLEHGLNLARATGGAFDPTLGRAAHVW
jgi:FAD:protein FMN transferase